MPRPVMTAILAFPLQALVLLFGARGTVARAEPSPEETIFQSSELRIYRTVNRDGTPIVVLTNVDADGQYFPGRDQRPIPYSPPPTAPLEARERETTPPVRVVVNRGDGESPAAADEVEVATDAGGGTTVIINIHPPPPPPRETVVIPAAYPTVIHGGLVGPFRYPERQYFLGYGPGIASPSYFSGLGLNAGNHYGLKTGVACDRGYDCMFGATRDHP